MTKAFLLGKLPFAVRGRYDFWDVRDAAEGPLSCSESGEYGRYIVSGHYAPLREMLQTMGRAANLKHRPIIVILAVITMNAILGTVQTVKAAASLDSLKQMSAPTAKVLRDG